MILLVNGEPLRSERVNNVKLGKVKFQTANIHVIEALLIFPTWSINWDFPVQKHFGLDI